MPSPIIQRKRATNIGHYDVKQTPFGLRLGEGPKGCLAIFGLFFAVPAIFMLAALSKQFPSIKGPELGTLEWAGLFILALAFAAFATGMMFYRHATEVDFRKREIRVMNGLFTAKSRDRFLFDDFENISVLREIARDSDSDDYVIYPVKMNSKTGHNVTLANYIRLEDSIRLAVEIAERSGLKAFDTTTETRLPLTTSDTTQSQNTPALTGNPLPDIGNVTYTWDNNSTSLSRLSVGQYHGLPAYRVTYPKPYGGALIGTGFGIGFYIYLFGWRIDETIVKIFEGFSDPRFPNSAEVFFSTLFGAAFTLFLVYIPLIRLVLLLLRPPYSALIVTTERGLYLHDPKRAWPNMKASNERFSHMTIPYGDIKSLDIKTAQTPKSRKQWKIEKRENFIAIRAGNKLYEIAYGLDWEQLNRIATEIQKRMLRTPNPN